MSDLNQIQTALERLFNDEEQRIVFWNDPEREFQGTLPFLMLDGVTTLRLDEVAALEAKIRIERDEPTGKFLLGITGNGANNGFASDDHVYVFSINQSTGVITPVTGSPFATQFTPANLAVNPNGTFVYTFNQTVTSISPMEGFQFNTTTGALTPLTTSPFAALTAPAGVFDESGAYLFMHPGTTLTVVSVDSSTGALTSIGSPISAIGLPVAWAATDPH